MHCLIINFNRLEYTRNLADFVHAHGITPVIIDNHSDYPPLLEYYSTTPFKVVLLEANFGHSVIWQIPILEWLGLTDKRFILTDPDLDLSGVPDDFLKVLNAGLDKYPQYEKCALSLEINDLPNSEEGNFIRLRAEKKYWKKPLDKMYFHADTDTTFALYREGSKTYNHSAIRTNRPYTARHLPWYYTDMNNLPEDEAYYYRTAGASCSHKNRIK